MSDPTAPAQRVTVRVPATSANLGPGFDSLGLALDWTARISVGIGGLPPLFPPTGGPEERMAHSAALALFTEARLDPDDSRTAEGLRVSVETDIPVGRGLGVSALARVGGLVATNRLLGDPLDSAALLRLATRLERHADNAAPALLGGLQIVVEDGEDLHQLGITPPKDLKLALLIPEFSMPTEESRQRLPERLTRAQSVHNIGRAALLVGALTERRYDLLRVATEDILHQPARASLFPAMRPAIAAAIAAGAHGAYLSGGGSTIAAFVTGDGAEVCAAMQQVVAQHGVEAQTRTVGLATTGAQVVEPETDRAP